MKQIGPQLKKMMHRCMSVVVLSLMIVLGMSSGANADEADAKRILMAMSEYMGSQQSLSFEFDAILEVVTHDEQKLGLASSGAVTLNRPDKIRVTRTGGFTDIEIIFDGKTLTLLGKLVNRYTQLDVPGTTDHLIDELKDTYNQPLPAADLLLSNAYDELMREVVDVKDLGSGVIGGIACDHLAFRTSEVDWQIWIAQGQHPYPYRFVITARLVNGGPQYSVQTRNWKAGDAVVATDFQFKNTTKAKKVDLKELKGADDLPGHFAEGGAK